jgi:pSer/pThr/pTyr-binding forkhead associated (FHA) protein/tetratricopeptide (TPR) repeat protein
VLKLIIEDDEGRKTVVPFVRDEITIGRQEGNTIRLTERNVSRRHARLVRLNGHVVVEDLGSYNGTRINGERIAGQSPLKEGDLIQIGDYDLALQAEGAASVSGPITTKVPSALRKTEPALEAMSAQEDEEEEDDTSDEPARREEDDGDEHDHTPPSSAEVRRHSTSIIRLDQVEADRPRKVVDVAAEDAPRLLVMTPDELRGQEFACIRTELRIGRTDDNDITLDHRSLSRTHAKLVREEGGEWRVIDMQSANGLTVNGESYAQATLGSGDIIELGHVKLRFLHAGDAADDVPAGEGGSRSKLPLVAGLAVLLMGAGAAGYYFFRPVAPVTPVTPVVAQPTPDTAPPPETPPTQGTEPANAAAAPREEPNVPAAPTGPSLEERLAKAQKAIEAREFDKAEDYLSSAKDAQGRRPAEAEKLLDTAKAERLMGQRIATARTALATGKLAEAETALTESADTQVFAADHSKLMAQLAEAQKKAAAAAAPPPVVNTANTVTASGTSEPPAEASVDKLLADIRALLKLQQEPKYREALRLAKECAKVSPNTADCHLMLGIVEARLGNIDRGADHYRRFIELAPESHKMREGVLKNLRDYDAAKQQQQKNPGG